MTKEQRIAAIRLKQRNIDERDLFVMPVDTDVRFLLAELDAALQVATVAADKSQDIEAWIFNVSHAAEAWRVRK